MARSHKREERKKWPDQSSKFQSLMFVCGINTRRRRRGETDSCPPCGQRLVSHKSTCRATAAATSGHTVAPPNSRPVIKSLPRRRRLLSLNFREPENKYASIKRSQQSPRAATSGRWVGKTHAAVAGRDVSGNRLASDGASNRPLLGLPVLLDLLPRGGNRTARSPISLPHAVEPLTVSQEASGRSTSEESELQKEVLGLALFRATYSRLVVTLTSPKVTAMANIPPAHIAFGAVDLPRPHPFRFERRSRASCKPLAKSGNVGQEAARWLPMRRRNSRGQADLEQRSSGRLSLLMLAPKSASSPASCLLDPNGMRGGLV